MHKALILGLAWVAGAGLGTLFFGGLLWTIRKGVLARQPAYWFLGSLLLRTGIVLAGFYYVGRGHWERLVVCLLGFVMARVLVLWLARPPAGSRSGPAQEASHAS